jgi:hypothetical protein
VQDEVMEMEFDGAVSVSSLAERVQARRAQLEARHTLRLEPPGYSGLLSVEYRPLSYSEVRAIARRHERIQDEATQELYMAADNLIAASIDSYDISGDEEVALGLRWGVELAHVLGFRDVVGDEFTPRQALFACFARDTSVVTHYGQYAGWLTDVEEQLDQEQAEGFPPNR